MRLVSDNCKNAADLRIETIGGVYHRLESMYRPSEKTAAGATIRQKTNKRNKTTRSRTE
jgi:hypothetical protein